MLGLGVLHQLGQIPRSPETQLQAPHQPLQLLSQFSWLQLLSIS
jgi:hypothetical protein